MNASHASLWTLSFPTPPAWDIRIATSSPVNPTYEATSRPFPASATLARTVSTSRALGWMWPPMEPISALITDSVTFMASSFLSLSDGFQTPVPFHETFHSRPDGGARVVSEFGPRPGDVRKRQ